MVITPQRFWKRYGKLKLSFSKTLRKSKCKKNGRWRDRTFTVTCTLVFKTSCHPFSGIFLEGVWRGSNPLWLVPQTSAATALASDTIMEPRRIELLTSYLQGRRSNQLSYDPINLVDTGQNRTDIFLLARWTLFQLSYRPKFCVLNAIAQRAIGILH